MVVVVLESVGYTWCGRRFGRGRDGGRRGRGRDYWSCLDVRLAFHSIFDGSKSMRKSSSYICVPVQHVRCVWIETVVALCAVGGLLFWLVSWLVGPVLN